jgi:hypothetical protein
MDLARFVAVLAKRALPLVRCALLADQFEGSVTRGVYERWKSNPENAAKFAKFRPEIKRDLYVSCWRAGYDESEAMWRLYCGSREGVAFQTTYERLDASLPSDVFLGKVTYLDYESGEMPWLSALSPIMHKRAAFAHEQEVRAVIWRSAYFVAQGMQPDEFPPAEPTLTMPWNAEEVLEHVFVSPYAEQWYRDVVADVLQRFAPTLADRLCWSRMKGVPLY